MRILHVLPDLRPEAGGPSRSVPNLCHALAAEGVDLSLYVTHVPGTPLAVNLVQEPYESELFPARRGMWGGASLMYRTIRERARQFDLIHIHSLWNSVVTLAAAAARREGVPYIIAPRGMMDSFCLRRRRLAKRLYAASIDRRTVEGAACLHFLSAAEAKGAHSSWVTKPERYFIAQNGINLNAERPEPGLLRQRLPELKGRKLVLSLGRLHPIKGLDLQVRALKYLVEEDPDITLVLVGPDDGEWRNLRELSRSMGLHSQVKWVGALAGAEKFSALAEADVFVQTSLYECHSMAINEALAVGVPIVITDTVNFNEVEGAGAGYVVQRDPITLAETVAAVLRTPSRAGEMRQAGRQFAATHLAWPQIAKKVVSAYEGILSKGSRSEHVVAAVPQPCAKVSVG